MQSTIVFGCTLWIALIGSVSCAVVCNDEPVCPVNCADWPWQIDILDMPSVAERVDMTYDPIGNGTGVHIYIIDSGIYYDHQEFLDADGVTSRARYSYDYNATCQAGGRLGEDEQGHGTTVASVAAGRNVGAARGAIVHSVKVGDCSHSHIAPFDGIDDVIKTIQHNQHQKNIVVLSVGIDASNPMNERVRNLTNLGALVVVAAGNSAVDACIKSPAGAPEAFTVGGMVRYDGLLAYEYSNFGPCIDILAPASFIKHAALDTGNGNGNCYQDQGSGTSIAAPIVAGVAAIYWERYPQLTVQQLKDRILADAFDGMIRFEGVQANKGTPNKMIHVISAGRIGDSEMEPAVSCSEIAMFRPDAPSKNYWLRGENEERFEVYCEMSAGFCGSQTKGWTTIAYMSMDDADTQCDGPDISGLREITIGSRRFCCKDTDESKCSSMKFPSHGIKYQKVCGRVDGYQYGTVDGFLQYNCPGCTIEDPYVDGFSITHGEPGQRQHIWTLAANNGESIPFCSCVDGSTQTHPAFVGNNYYCESANSPGQDINQVHLDDLLWDGDDCDGGESQCCQGGDYPWFTTTLSAATADNLEVRLCTDEGYEDVPFDLVHIFVQ